MYVSFSEFVVCNKETYEGGAPPIAMALKAENELAELSSALMLCFWLDVIVCSG